MNKERMEDQITLSPLAEGEGSIELVNIKNLDFNDPEAVCTFLERYHAVPDLKLSLERNLANDPIRAARHVSLEGFNPEKEADGVKVLVMAAAKTQAAENSLKLSEKQKNIFDGIRENLIGAAGWFAKDKKAVKIGTSLAIFSMALSACNNISIPDTIKTIFPSTPLVTEMAPSQNPSETPTQEATVTPTQTETTLPTTTRTSLPPAFLPPTETPTPTEAPRFVELLPLTLEDCIQKNVLRSDTPEHFQADLGLLREKELAVMDPSPENYSRSGISGGSPATSDRLNLSGLFFKNPKMSSCSYVDFGEGRQYLILGFYLNSFWTSVWGIPEFRYTMPIHFALDLNLEKNIPNVFIPDQVPYVSLYYNNEKNYKDLINNQISHNIFLYGVYPYFMEPVLPDSSIDKKLEWLYFYQNRLSNRFVLSDQIMFSHSNSGISTDELTQVHEWASHFIFPIEFLSVQG